MEMSRFIYLTRTIVRCVSLGVVVLAVLNKHIQPSQVKNLMTETCILVMLPRTTHLEHILTESTRLTLGDKYDTQYTLPQ
jgi:hypothetical protein